MKQTNCPLIIGIVGSRKRNTLFDRKIVFDIVSRFADKEVFKEGVVIVSGGAKGPDSFAEEAARFYGLQTKIFPVEKDKEIKTKYDFTLLAYKRNSLIAEESNDLFALVCKERKGGTEDTVKKMLALKKNVFLVYEDGSMAYISPDGKKQTNKT